MAHILCGILRLLRVNVVFLTHAFYFEFNLQLPRLYNVYKQMGIVKSFQNIIDNVFIPLFEVTIDPSSHPQLHVFLLMVSIVCLLFCTYRLNNECLIVSFRIEMIRVLCHCQCYSDVVFTCVNFLWFLLLLISICCVVMLLFDNVNIVFVYCMHACLQWSCPNARLFV